MKVAIMQPYFFPYIGYFQLINAVDEFVVYDNIKYTKKGWINRNRILHNGKDEYVTLSLKNDSDYLNVVNRELSSEWDKDRVKILNKIKSSYHKAPHFNEVYPLVENCLAYDDPNLFRFILNSLTETMKYFSIDTHIVISSTIDIDHSLKSDDKVIAICKALKADTYLNPIGGMELYHNEKFTAAGVKLQFIKTSSFEYQQFGNSFIPFLSIIDLMMFNEKNQLHSLLNNEYQIL
ncbi:MAG: WbqC family protein [Chitinophagaceae bacterium]